MTLSHDKICQSYDIKTLSHARIKQINVHCAIQPVNACTTSCMISFSACDHDNQSPIVHQPSAAA